MNKIICSSLDKHNTVVILHSYKVKVMTNGHLRHQYIFK